MSRYEELKKELPAMAELVQLFPEATQGKVLDVLVDTLLDRSAGTKLDATTGGGLEPEAKGGHGKRPAAKVYPCTIVKGLDLGEAAGGASFEEFCGSKNPLNRVEKVAVAVYYLKQMRTMERVGINHVFTCFMAIKNWRKPSNLRAWIWEASSNRYGYVDARVSDDLQMGMRGVNLVEKELPRI